MNTIQPQARNRKNLRRPWTADEDARLRSLLAAGTSVALVAAKLKRTVVLLQLAAVHSVYRWRAADVELDAGLAFRLQPPMFPVMQFRPAIPTWATKVPTSPDTPRVAASHLA
jgi:hypothetical protein